MIISWGTEPIQESRQGVSVCRIKAHLGVGGRTQKTVITHETERGTQDSGLRSRAKRLMVERTGKWTMKVNSPSVNSTVLQYVRSHC